MSLKTDHIKEDKFYSLCEAAGILDVHYNTIRSRIRKGVLAYIKEPEGQYRIQGQFLIDYLQQHHHTCDNT